MSKPDFVYTTYIKTTPDKLWRALTTPEFTRQYWGGFDNISDWKVGSEWKGCGSDGRVKIIGKVLESNPPKRLVLTWSEPADPSDESQVTFEIQPMGDMVCLNVVHGHFIKDTTMASRISGGWPLVLSSLKSFLESGSAIDIVNFKSCSNAA